MKEWSLLAEERENRDRPPTSVTLRRSNAAEGSAIGRRISKPCILSCRALAVLTFSRNAERIGPGADNKGKMPEDRKNESEAGCRKPAKMKERLRL